MSRKRHEQDERARGGDAGHEREPFDKSSGEPRAYDAQGSKAEAEALDKKDGFKRGGHKKAAKRKKGGKAEGHKAPHRADKPRRARGGRSPMSAAAKVRTRAGMDEGASVDREAD